MVTPNELTDLLPLKKRIDAVPDEKIAEILIKTEGLIYLAADIIGYTGSAVAKRVRESPYLTAIIEECRERRIDQAEASLSHLVSKPKDLGAICFTLKTLGKRRGYVEHEEQKTSPEALAKADEVKEQIRITREELMKKLESI